VKLKVVPCDDCRLQIVCTINRRLEEVVVALDAVAWLMRGEEAALVFDCDFLEEVGK